MRLREFQPYCTWFEFADECIFCKTWVCFDEKRENKVEMRENWSLLIWASSKIKRAVRLK